MSQENGHTNQLKGETLSGTDSSAPASGEPVAALRSKGQGLVEAFRKARITQRPQLRTELRESRVALHQSRLRQIGHRGPLAAPPHAEQISASAHPALMEAPHPSATGEASSSIFATLCVAPEPRGVPPQQLEPSVPPADISPPQPEPKECSSSTVHNAIPLSAIGFGPGMTIRMSHLGITTLSQLAAADPDWLRTSLGDLSQLVNAELWIAAARKACAEAA